MSVTIFVPDIPELHSLLEAAEKVDGCTVEKPTKGYWRIEADDALEFDRKALGLGPALWNSALSGGFQGKIVQYDRYILRIESEMK